MADKPKRGLTPEQWAEARKAYESGESEQALSKRLSVDRKTIRTRKVREAWIPHVEAQVGKAESEAIRQTVRSNVIDMASRRAIDDAQADGTIDAIAAEVKSGLALHGTIELLALSFAQQTLQMAVDRKLRRGKNSSEANERKDAMAAVALAIEMSREIAGKRPGTPSVATDDAAKPRGLRFIGVPEETSEAS